MLPALEKCAEATGASETPAICPKRNIKELDTSFYILGISGGDEDS